MREQTKFRVECNSLTVDAGADTVNRSHFDLVCHKQRQVVDSDRVDGRIVSEQCRPVVGVCRRHLLVCHFIASQHSVPCLIRRRLNKSSSSSPSCIHTSSTQQSNQSPSRVTRAHRAALISVSIALSCKSTDTVLVCRVECLFSSQLSPVPIYCLVNRGTCVNNLTKVERETPWLGIEPVTSRLQVRCPNHYATTPHSANEDKIAVVNTQPTKHKNLLY